MATTIKQLHETEQSFDAYVAHDREYQRALDTFTAQNQSGKAHENLNKAFNVMSTAESGWEKKVSELGLPADAQKVLDTYRATSDAFNAFKDSSHTVGLSDKDIESTWTYVRASSGIGVYANAKSIEFKDPHTDKAYTLDSFLNDKVQIIQQEKEARAHEKTITVGATAHSHIVQKGETLSEIARHFIHDQKLAAPDGTNANSHALAMVLIIAKKNGIEDINKLHVGKPLEMPNADEISNGLGQLSENIMAASGVAGKNIGYQAEMAGHKTSELIAGDLETPRTILIAQAAAHDKPSR